jgi:DNA-binding MarR family transcriptional regulator
MFVGAFKRRARSAYTDPTLPYPQQCLLRRLELDGPATTADLARAELITPQTTGTFVAELEAAGHVVRRNDPHDGRRRVIVLTTAGRKALAERRISLDSWIARTIEQQLDAAEQRTLAGALVLLNKLLAP